MNFIKSALAAAALAAVMAPATAAVVVLDFEGVGNNNPVGDFYNGGAGTNYGVQFSADTLALIDADAPGGTGNFANEPSPNTIMFFLTGSTSTLDYAAGFSTGFSFFYTSSTAATVTVYDGLGGTGNVLGSINLTAQSKDNCVGDPNGSFCNWTSVGVGFSGTALSIDFGGTADRTGFDNITFGSETPVQGIPEPSTYAMLALGLAGVGVVARRRKAA